MSIIPRSAVIHRVCPEYGAVEHYPSGAFDVVVEGGNKYPDVLGCGAFPFLIVSGAVVKSWLDSGVRSFHTFPVGIAGVKSKRLENVAPPAYFRIEVDGRCWIDLAASGLQVVRFCEEHHHLITRPSVAGAFRIAPGTWDGSPLFRDASLYPQVSFCTTVVLDLARDHRFTNFRFEPMEGPFDSSGKGIDYLKHPRETRPGRL